MCTRYASPTAGDMERRWHVGGRDLWHGAEVFPDGIRRRHALIFFAKNKEATAKESILRIDTLEPHAWLGEDCSRSATGVSDTTLSLDAAEREATPCRRTFIYSRAGGSSATSRLSLCNREGGSWRMAQ